MEKKYSAKYEETKEVLAALCEIFHQDKFELSILIGIGAFGSLLLALVLGQRPLLWAISLQERSERA